MPHRTSICKCSILFFYTCGTMSEDMISKTKLFVGGLPRRMRGKELREMFSEFGAVKFATVKLKPDGKSRGFGFVEFEGEEDAIKAQVGMDGKDVEGRAIAVAFAKELPPREDGEERPRREFRRNEDDEFANAA